MNEGGSEVIRGVASSRREEVRNLFYVRVLYCHVVLANRKSYGWLSKLWSLFGSLL